MYYLGPGTTKRIRLEQGGSKPQKQEWRLDFEEIFVQMFQELGLYSTARKRNRESVIQTFKIARRLTLVIANDFSGSAPCSYS